MITLSPNHSVNEVASPNFQVVSSQKKFEVTLAHQIAGKNSIHFTHLHLLDGSGDVMVGRCNTNLAHDGAKLRAGEMVQLHLFTPLTYVMSSGADQGNLPRAPMVVIHTFSRIGYSPLPQNVSNPITCVKVTESCESTISNDGEFDTLVDYDCTPQQRYCAKYGLSPIMCVCQTDPPENINLEVVHEYCWFATKDVADMDNGNKRNMLYWWYMTNIYNIGGRGVTKKPPECLSSPTRHAYPEKDGKYKGYRKSE